MKTETPNSAVVIRSDRLIDGASPEPISGGSVQIDGDRIVNVGPDLSIPSGARVIDLTGYTLLPGLIDAHTHVCYAPLDGKNPVLEKSIAFRALEGAAAARASLNAGFTTLRDTDSEGAQFADVAVRDAIRLGLIPGPRLFVSTRALTITGGHLNQTGLAPEINERVPQLGAVADTLDEMIKEVRRQVKYGADWIKVYATGTTRHIDQKSLEVLPQFDEEKIRAVVTEARRWRKDVAAHAYGGEGARAAVLGGARSIEHGMLLDESILNLMVKHGTYWCPTLSNFTPTQALVGYPESFIQAIMARHTEAFEMALRLGVRMAFGTDAGRVRHGTNAGEFALMVERGMDRMRAIQAATSVAAELLRMEDEIGAVKTGLQADLVAVAGDPLEDVSLLQDVPFVMKGGQVFKSPEGLG